MGYKIREIDTERQFCEQGTVDVIHQVIGLNVIQQVIEEQQVKEQLSGNCLRS